MCTHFVIGLQRLKNRKFCSPRFRKVFVNLLSMNRWILLGVIAASLLASACSEELKKNLAATRKGSIAERDSAAFFFYQRGDYERAGLLFEDLRAAYRGQERAKTFLYHLALCKYNQGLYGIAAYYFEEYARAYPNDEKTPECAYMVGYCYYLESAPPYLDQSDTRRAINQLQLFVNTFPYADKVADAEKLMKELRERLASKEFENAKLYYRIENYKAAVTALETMIQSYPDSRYREEAQFLLFKSSVSLADLSIANKQKNRYLDALEFYQRFVDKYPNSPYLKEAEALYLKAKKSLGKLLAEGNSSAAGS